MGERDQPLRSSISSLKRWTVRLLDYVRQFGLLGLPLMVWLHWRYLLRSNAPVHIRLNKSNLGIWIRPRLDLGIFHQVFVEREYDFEIEANPSLIIDGGANIGCASVYFALRFPNALIYAIEPNAATFELLRRNAAQMKHIKPILGALWHENAPIEIVDPGAHHLALQVRSAATSNFDGTIPGMTIDKILNSSKCDTIDVLKLDIEGSEEELFAHPGPWLDRVSCVVIEFHNDIRPGSEEKIRNTISKHWAHTEQRSGENIALTRLNGRT